MIALITSTLKPQTAGGEPKSFFSDGERLQQTMFTIKSIEAKGISQIILADNSDEFDFKEIKALLPRVKIMHFNQFQFKNKGINELLILLGTLKDIPPDTPIFKISGRYYPNENFIPSISTGFDFKVKGYSFYSKRGSISTRGYLVKDKVVFEKFLLQCLSELFLYQSRVVGIRSLWSSLGQFFKPYAPLHPSTSIEFASARILKSGGYRIEFADPIGISGAVAGFKTKDLVIE